MPPRQKKTAPHDRSNNNSQGLAAPGRRITKQKSNSNLSSQSPQSNGHTKPPLPSTASDELLDSPSSCDALHVNGPQPDAKMGASHSHPVARPREPSGASEHDLEAHACGQSTPTCPSPLRIDVAAAGKSADDHRLSMLALTKTILSAYPLWDVLAILIILLQLPPVIVTVVHAVFIVLTFVAPATTALLNLPTLNELFSSSNGVPSIPVLVSLDLLALVVFCMVTVPMQNVVLDLAQAVIAISLGGAAASRGGTTRSVSWCFLIIFISHLFRWRPARQIGVNLLWMSLTRTGLQPVSEPPTIADSSVQLEMRPNWPRSLLGVHILVQGSARVIRRYLLWRNSDNPPGSNVKRVDPEAGTGSVLNTPRTSTSQLEPINDAGSTASTSSDGRPPGPSPAAREGKEKSSNLRKKKRQATHVRSQQPFWAALASSKVSWRKADQPHRTVDTAEAHSAGPAHIGNADFTSGSDKVWVRNIGSSEVLFGLTLPSTLGEGDTPEDGSEPVGISTSRPFYIRVNGAVWSSTKVEDVEHTQGPNGSVDVWLGRIFGLTAYSPYHIEFVRLDGDALIHAASLITLAAPSTDQAPIVSAPSQTLRPSSPTTTLKNSIAAAEQHLDSLRIRLKRNRKDHKASMSSIQRELDGLSGRLHSSGGSDDRHRARIKQLEQSIRRAEEETGGLEADIGGLVAIPDSETKDWTEKRAALRKERDQRDASRQAFQLSRTEADHELEKVQLELQSVQQKHQRSQQRQAKVSERHENLVAQKAQVQEDKMRRALDRSTALEQRAQEEQRFLNFIAKYQRDAQNEQFKVAQLKAQAKHLDDIYKTQAAQQASQQSVATIPDGPLPGSAGNRNSFPAAGSSFAGFSLPTSGGFVDHMGMANGTPHHSSPTAMYPGAVGPPKQRGRSSSMLSGMSGFTDDVAEDFTSSNATAPPPLPPFMFSPSALPPFRHEGWRKSSQGSASLRGSGSRSGSGSGSGAASVNSSTRDPMSPAPNGLSPVGSGALPSPISPPPKGQREGSR